MTNIAQIGPSRVVVGVDTHKETHTAVALDQLGKMLNQLAIPTSPAGYRKLLNWSLRLGNAPSFGIEGTGSYGAGLSRFLLDQGLEVIEVDRPNRRARRLKGKSDPLDAEQAARAVLAGVASAKPKAADAEVEMARALKVARSSAVKAMSQASHSLHNLVVTAPAELRQSLRGLTATVLVGSCAAFRPGVNDSPTTATKVALRSLARRIQSLKAEIKALDGQLAQLTNRVPELVQIFGAGPEVASTLMVTAGDNPDRLYSESAFASLCGVSPIPASSGKTERHRLNRSGDRRANAALHRIVIVRLRYHEPTKRYVERRTAEGKSKQEIIRCLKRYVAREVFAALRAMGQRRLAIPG